jgi:nucleotide-binding universal stress UspA family protein
VTKFLVDTILSADVTDAYPDRGLGDDVIGRRARYADITLLGPEVLADEWLKRKSIEGVLFHSGKPLLLAPLESSPTMKPRRVLVAWDSLLASSRAVREALDLITGADETRIVLIDPAKGEIYHGDEPGADIAAYLTRHGAHITVDRLPSENRTVPETLKEHATAVAADFLVMGAYGHSQFREYLFGGVTRAVLENPFMPTLMAR